MGHGELKQDLLPCSRNRTCGVDAARSIDTAEGQHAIRSFIKSIGPGSKLGRLEISVTFSPARPFKSTIGRLGKTAGAANRSRFLHD
jgi:hypothetical protein